MSRDFLRQKAMLGILAALLIAPHLRGAPPCPLAPTRPGPDFNCDGYADLAVGAPGESGGDGVVHVIFGGITGLTAAHQRINPGHLILVEGIAGNQAGQGFGSSLAWGDFNGDGYHDLAIGVPYHNASPALVDTGFVYVLRGYEGGLRTDGVLHFQSTYFDGPLNVNLDPGDQFGAALAAGDFNGDGYDDLAIGVPGQDGQAVWNGPPILDAGEVYVVYGSPRSLIRSSAQGWSLNARCYPISFPGHPAWKDIEGDVEESDRFGSSLAAGDFNGDGWDDLAIGIPGKFDEAGAVSIIYGSAGRWDVPFAGGLDPNPGTANQFFDQNSPGVPGVRAAGSQFGFSLAAGNFRGLAVDDLAIGAPKAPVGAAAQAGEVIVMYGTEGGLDLDPGPPVGSQRWTAASAGIPDDGSLEGDQFGYALAAADFNGDGKFDLAIGAPKADPGVVDSGSVTVIYGNPGVLNPGLNAFAVPAQYFHQGVPGIALPLEIAQRFGYSLAAGDFNGDLRTDLAVGVPGDLVAGVRCGAVNVIYGLPISLVAGPPGAHWWHQNNLLPLFGDFCDAGDGFGILK